MTQTVSGSNTNQRQMRGVDSFATGVVAILLASVLQRVLGLGRNLGFCTFLSDDELGKWALANGFFVIAAPIVALGLPGSFGKFVEHFRQQGCLGQYIRRVIFVCTLAIVAFVLVMVAVPQWMSRFLYGELTEFSVIFWTAITLATVTGFNIVYELVISLRLVRVSSVMQFLNVAVFALVGVLAIWHFETWVVLLPSYAIACTVATIPGIWSLSINARDVFQTSAPMPVRRMWSRIASFAIMLWLANLLSNLFELSDRYMLLHLCHGGQEQGQSLVGQFYCGRIIPNLLAGLALVFFSMILPYLSLDWEDKRFESIRRRMNNVLTTMAIAFTGGSALALAAAPLLFQWGLGGRFSQGESILALSLVQTIWGSISLIASAYLMCAEKGRQNTLLLAAAVVLNIVLNWPLIYYFDLFGSVVATAIANLLLMLATMWRVHREGCQLGARTLALCLAPIILVTGAGCSLACLLILTVLAGRTNWVLSSDDRKWLDGEITPRLRAWKLPIESLWPRTSPIQFKLDAQASACQD